MADLLVVDSDRDALVGAGILLGALEGSVVLRVVSTLPETTRLLHDLRRSYTRIFVVGVPAADSGSLRSALSVLQVRGVGVSWFDSHDLLWTTELRALFDRLGVNLRLPEIHRPETERTGGLVLSYLVDSGHPRVVDMERDLRAALAEARDTGMGGREWVALLDAVEHDHRLVTVRAIRGAAMKVWDREAPLNAAEKRLVALHRSREARVARFLDELERTEGYGQELLRFNAERYRELRFVRPRFYTEAARRRLGAEYAQARVERGWVFACRDPYRAGLDLPVTFLDRLYDLDVTVHGYPYRANVRMEGGADVDERLMMVLEKALEEERSGRRGQPPPVPREDEEVDW